MSKLPSKTLDLSFNDKDYTINFPKTGQLMKIEALKAKLLFGEQSTVIDAGTADGDYAYQLANMEAHLTVVSKEMIEDLNVKSISELDAIDSAQLLDAFMEQYLPWFNDWRTILQNGGKPVEKSLSPQEEVAQSNSSDHFIES